MAKHTRGDDDSVLTGKGNGDGLNPDGRDRDTFLGPLRKGLLKVSGVSLAF